MTLQRGPIIERLIQFCVVGFVASVVGAMFAYPGGTWWDTHAVDHWFW